MVKKKDILSNLRQFSIDEIVELIKDGTVTLYELSKSGNMTPLTRMKIEAKLQEKRMLKGKEEINYPPETDTSESDEVIIPEAIYNSDFDNASEVTEEETTADNVVQPKPKRKGFLNRLFNK